MTDFNEVLQAQAQAEMMAQSERNEQAFKLHLGQLAIKNILLIRAEQASRLAMALTTVVVLNRVLRRDK